MHHQLHHEAADENKSIRKSPKIFPTAKRLFKEHGSFTYRKNKMPDFSDRTTPRSISPDSIFSKYSKNIKLPHRSTSATRLFDKLRTRICRSKTLFAHPEESASSANTTCCDIPTHDTSADITSDCTSKALKLELSRTSTVTLMKDVKEIFSCHLCNFDADRITILDRHLLNDHKIGLESLLQLVMAKTKQGLSDSSGPTGAGIRQPYYKNSLEIIDEGEFILETVTPKIKVLKNTATNTDLKWTDIPDLKDNCRMITKELEKMMSESTENFNKDDFLEKMQTLNECMCKFMDSSKSLKRTLTKELGSKHSARDRLSLDQPFLELSLAGRDTAREWERAHSENMERHKSKYGDINRPDKSLVAESFYF